MIRRTLLKHVIRDPCDAEIFPNSHLTISLIIDNQNIEDTSFMEGFPKIKFLTIRKSSIKDYSFLEHLNIEELQIYCDNFTLDSIKPSWINRIPTLELNLKNSDTSNLGNYFRYTKFLRLRKVTGDLKISKRFKNLNILEIIDSEEIEKIEIGPRLTLLRLYNSGNEKCQITFFEIENIIIYSCHFKKIVINKSVKLLGLTQTKIEELSVLDWLNLEKITFYN